MLGRSFNIVQINAESDMVPTHDRTYNSPLALPNGANAKPTEPTPSQRSQRPTPYAPPVGRPSSERLSVPPGASQQVRSRRYCRRPRASCR